MYRVGFWFLCRAGVLSCVFVLLYTIIYYIISYTIIISYLILYSSLLLFYSPLPFLSFPPNHSKSKESYLPSFPSSPLLFHPNLPLIHSIRVGTYLRLFIFLYNIPRQSIYQFILYVSVLTYAYLYYRLIQE